MALGSRFGIDRVVTEGKKRLKNEAPKVTVISASFKKLLSITFGISRYLLAFESVQRAL